jgi:hypothetical protein
MVSNTPPLSALKRSLNDLSASAPGAKSDTMLTTFLMPFLAAQSAMITDDCGSVKLVRAMYGERSVMIDVPAAITSSTTLASVASGAAASAAGVTPKPAMTLTLSLTISSWAMRLVLSGTAPSSLTMTSIFLPATVSPFSFI